MDEHQITDRVEGGKPEPGITDRPAGSSYAPPPAAPPRRKWRWWLPITILVLMGGLIAYLQFGPPPTKSWDAAFQFFSTAAACVLTGLLLYLWFAFFSGFRWRMKLLLGGAGLLAIVAFCSLFTIYGSSGNMGWHFVPRWWTPPDYALPKLSDGAIHEGRDATVRPGDFPQFLGPDRNAVVRGVFLDRDWGAHPPKEVWRQKEIGAGWGAFAVAGDLAITQEQRGDDEWIVARDRKTGETVWSHANRARFSETMGGDGPRATPTIAAGKVFALGATGIFDCLDASTGQLRWTHDVLRDSGEKNLDWAKSSSPLVINDLGLVVVSLGSGGSGGTLAAYDVKTGDRKWVGGTDRASYASPMLATLGGKPQIVSVNQGTVTGHDPADGKVLWSYDWQPQAPAKASQPPVLPGDRLLLTAGYGSPGVLLHVKRDGNRWAAEEEWTTSHMRTKFTTPVVRDHYAYGLDDGVLACIDLNDEGKLVWRARGDDFGHGQVLLVEDLLLVQGEMSGELLLVEASPQGYHKLGALHDLSGKTWNNPALAGNHLFVRNDQEAACYELATVEKRAEK